MKKSYYSVPLLIVAIACFSCGDAPKDNATNDEVTVDSTAAPAADTTVAPNTAASPQQAVVQELAAFYNGLLPCKDCDGIQTLLTLNADQQQSFTLSEEYKGKKPKTVETNGTWSVMGNIITLNSKNGTFKYQVNSEGLVGLNPDGSAMDVSKYLLKKVQGE